MSKRPLTHREMAAISAGVPMSGDKEIDAILSVALRLKIATEVLAGETAHGGAAVISSQREQRAEWALEQADALLSFFDTDKRSP